MWARSGSSRDQTSKTDMNLSRTIKALPTNLQVLPSSATVDTAATHIDKDP